MKCGGSWHFAVLTRGPQKREEVRSFLEETEAGEEQMPEEIIPIDNLPEEGLWENIKMV